jgi:hypothetical protein
MNLSFLLLSNSFLSCQVETTKFHKITTGNQLLSCTPFFVPLKITTQPNQLLCTPLFVPVKITTQPTRLLITPFSCHIKGNYYMPRSFRQPCHRPNFCPAVPIHFEGRLQKEGWGGGGGKGGGQRGFCMGHFTCPQIWA